MKPPHDEHITPDAYEALRQDRDRWFNITVEQQQYIRQLENLVKMKDERINELMHESMKNKEKTQRPVIKKFYGPYIENNNLSGGNQILAAENVYLPGAENVSISNAKNVQSCSPPSSSASDVRTESSHIKRLFLNEFGDEDPQRTAEEHNRFMNFLTDHHWSQLAINSRRDNRILQSVVCFCIKWRRIRYIKDPVSPAAVLRFLTDTCHLSCDVERTTISTVLGKMLKSDHNKELYFDMENYF
ncbi:MAG: hypothetical protein II644_01365 [Paludibacteraceae bacterium]|nr:hypothetical protein [Paludibacteraceae bacterium]